jgi:sn-glycerol 3-phosphate transport system substrate-binding protein
MGIVYYNKTLMEAVGVPLERIPTTWEEIFVLSRKLKEKGIIGFTFPWTCAYTLEYCASLHNIPLTTNNNGFAGKPEFKLHEVAQYRDFFITNFEAVRDGLYHHETDNSAGAETYFAKNPCAMLMQGSGRMETIQQTFKKEGKDVAFAYGPLPYDSRFVGSPNAPKIGGTGIWVTRKGSINPAVKRFLEFVCNPENQASWSRLSGYMPSTCESDAILEKSGFYETNPHVKVAAEQARRPASALTHVRIPKYDEIRGKVFMKHYVNAIEQVKKGERPIPDITQEFLKSFSDEANAIIEATYKP